jgi:predicted transcriptional regulator of viral defense system
MYIEELARAKKTVFSVADFRILWKIDDSAYLKTVISRLFRRGSIIRLSRGIYALDDSYDRFELANKLKVPSYVSLETVLAKGNIIFQRYDDVIYSVSDRATTKRVGKTEYRYRRLVKRVLLDPLGVREEGGARVASVERAVCDRLFLSPGYHFDNLRGLDPERLQLISRIYNKRVRSEVSGLVRHIYADHT